MKKENIEIEEMIRKSNKQLLFLKLKMFIEKFNINFRLTISKGDLENEEFLDNHNKLMLELTQSEIRKLNIKINKELKNIRDTEYFKFKKNFEKKRIELEEFLEILNSNRNYPINSKDEYDFPEIWLNLIENKEKNLFNKIILDFDDKIKKIDENYKNLEEKQKDELFNFTERFESELKTHTKDILGTMGIFLSIFSVIGLGVSSILRLESNHIKIWLMLCGAILITMSGLFYLIDPDKFIKQEDTKNDNCEKLVNCMKKPIIIGITLLIVGGLMKYESLEENKKLVEQGEFEKVKKDVENLSKNLDTKDLKFEIEKLKSKIEELENNKSKNRKK